MDYLKVSSKSSPASVAGAVAGMVKEGVPVVIQSVGAGAVNQAVKAVAIARGFLAPSGLDVACVPTFHEIQIDGEARTAIRLQVVPVAPQAALSAGRACQGGPDGAPGQASPAPAAEPAAAGSPAKPRAAMSPAESLERPHAV